MKKGILFFIGILITIQFFAQTGIGTTTPNPSAKLDVYAADKGFLPPRVTLTSTSSSSPITAPAEGLLVYNLGSVGLQAGYYYWNGANWATIATATSAGNGVTSMDMVKLYGEAWSNATGKIANTNGYTFTVPVSGRYLFDFSSTTYGSSGFTINFYVRQGTTNIGSDGQVSTNNGVRVEYNGKVEVNLQAGTTYNVYVTSNNPNRGSEDYDRVYYKIVAGNLPVTGQTVDYVSVGTIYQTAIGDNRDLIFTSKNGGNIPYNTTTGVFTLSANKTYLFQAQVRANTPSVNSSYIEYGFVDATTNALLINGTETITSSTTATGGYGSNPVINFIYTPTTNQTVKLRTTINTNGTQAIVSGTANITQIGSSAIINSWTLSGTNTYNTTGNVGIGTSTPNASAILDISSSSKGVLPPKVELIGRNGTSSPIASPTTGLFVYNTAEAGAASNAVSPGFYFYNGTNWTRMDPEDWSIPVTITIGAVTTSPTKGTIVYDNVSYRRTSTTSFEVTYNYSQSTLGTAGSGDYLFRLPGNLTFGSSVLKTTSDTYETLVNRVIIGNGYYGDAAGRFRPLGIIPYDNNRFRIMVMDNAFSGLIVGSSAIGLNTDGVSYKFSFILETN